MKNTMKYYLLCFLIFINVSQAGAKEVEVNSRAFSGQAAQTTFYQPTGEIMHYNVLGKMAIINGDIAVGYADFVAQYGIRNLAVKHIEVVPTEDIFTPNLAWSGNTTWPGSTVPYAISAESQGDFEAIENGMLLISTRTGVKFVPRTNEADYIEVIKGTGCWSHVGRLGGRQELSIGSGCEYADIVAHEFLHASGFFHEQSRYDRDNHVRINWENITPGREHNFNKGSEVTASVGPYDFKSIMHYGYMAFSENGLPTIESLDPYVSSSELGQSSRLTDLDVAGVTEIYGTGGNPSGGPQGYTRCADEGQVCTFPGKASVAFGAIGKYHYREAENQIPCSNGVFTDPVINIQKSCYFKLEDPAGIELNGFTHCATEGEECVTGGPAVVAFGAQGRYYFLKTADRIPCNNITFSDPADNIVKDCYFKADDSASPEGFTFCASENEICSFVGAAEVTFGANGQYSTQRAFESIYCSNAMFGDPTFDVSKGCYYQAYNAIPAGFSTCAVEGETCTFSGDAVIAYGANGVYTYREASSSVDCSNSTFGDPILNVQKACYIRQ